MASKHAKNTNDPNRNTNRRSGWILYLFYLFGALLGFGVYMLQNM